MNCPAANKNDLFEFICATVIYYVEKTCVFKRI